MIIFTFYRLQTKEQSSKVAFYRFHGTSRRPHLCPQSLKRSLWRMRPIRYVTIHLSPYVFIPFRHFGKACHVNNSEFNELMTVLWFHSSRRKSAPTCLWRKRRKTTMRMTSMRVVHGGDEGNTNVTLLRGKDFDIFFKLIQADLMEITSLGFF